MPNNDTPEITAFFATAEDATAKEALARLIVGHAPKEDFERALRRAVRAENRFHRVIEKYRLTLGG